jgi:kinesin family protein 6/9
VSARNFGWFYLHTSFVDSFKQMVGDLRQLKTEIEHLQHLLEKAKVKMQKDFEIWWAEQGALIQVTITIPYPL